MTSPMQIKRNVICVALSTLFQILHSHVATSSQQQNVTLSNDKPTILRVQPTDTIVIYPEDPLSAAYIVCQAHSQAAEITLSTKPQVDYATSKHGRDVGVVSMVDSELKWYIFSNSTSEIRVLLHLMYYSGTDPLPGGCNEEFNLENDPNINLVLTQTKALVHFQWSNTGWLPNLPGTFPNCDDSRYWPDLHYHGYVNYIQGADFSEETYFDTVTQMLTADRVAKHGKKIKTLENNKVDVSTLDIASYQQQGVIYSVVVTLNNPINSMKSRAAYIPVVTYACDIGLDCDDKDTAAIIFTTVAAIVGCFICFMGHRYFKTENFVFGFLIFGLIFYQVLHLKTSISSTGVVAMAIVFGLIGGCLLLGLWWYFGMPVLNVLFIALVGGYLISSILFYTPFANLTYWDSAFNYGATFTCGLLIVPVVLLVFTKILNILTCTFVGSYGVIIALDVYVRGGMRYMVVNSFRHGTDTSYVKVIVTGPFTITEIALTCVWVVIFVSGTVFQLYRERKKAPFPPCPRQERRRSADLRRLLLPEEDPTPNERAPLLRGNNLRQEQDEPRHYGH